MAPHYSTRIKSGCEFRHGLTAVKTLGSLSVGVRQRNPASIPWYRIEIGLEFIMRKMQCDDIQSKKNTGGENTGKGGRVKFERRGEVRKIKCRVTLYSYSQSDVVQLLGDRRNLG